MSKYGIIACNLGFQKEGLEAVEQSIVLLQPDSVYIYSLYKAISDSYLLTRNFSKALSNLKQAMSYHKNTKDYYQMGNIFHLYNDDKNAEKYLVLFINRVKENNEEVKYSQLLNDSQELLESIKIDRFFQGNQK